MNKFVKGIALLSVLLTTSVSVMGMEAQGNVLIMSPLQQQTQVLSYFGENRGSYNHQGIDVMAAMGTPLYAVADGMITKAAPDSKGVSVGGGHMIFIDHGDGTESRYMHLDAYAVATGQRVRAGDLIGFTGISGDATAPLLHYEYRIYGQPVDPYFLFASNGSLDPMVDSFLAIQQ
ncbi:MAG: M23 family metallopeptidase [Cellulosilyticaceae bacterium]